MVEQEKKVKAPKKTRAKRMILVKVNPESFMHSLSAGQV
jgi:hypothetical protein